MSAWSVVDTRTVALLALRAINIGSKFLLLLVLGIKLPLADIGDLALLMATTQIISALAALEVHRVLGRELVLAAPEKRVVLLRDHAAHLFLAGLLASCVVLVLSLAGVIRPSLATPVAVLTGLMVVAADQTRLLLVLERPIGANLQFTLHNASWALVAAALLWALPAGAIGLTEIVDIWLTSTAIAVVFAGFLLKDLPWPSTRSAPIDTAALKRRITAAIPAAAATALLIGMSLADRFLVRILAGAEVLGILFYYVSIIQVVTVIVDTLIYQTRYPELVRTAAKDRHNFSILVRRFLRISMCVAALSAPCLALLALATASLSGKAELAGQWQLASVLAVAFVLDALASTQSNILFSDGRDTAVFRIQIVDACTLFLVGVPAIWAYGLMGGAILWLVRGIVRVVAFRIAIRHSLKKV